MSELQIPDIAWTAAGSAVDASARAGVRVRGRGAVAVIVTAAAPYIVAAELRRAAERFDAEIVALTTEAEAFDGTDSGPITGRIWGLSSVVDQLRIRADKLDGGA